MQPQSAAYEPTERLSLCDKLEAYLKDRPGMWIDGSEFERVAGKYAWRTRLSDLRRKRGMRIENRVRTIKRDGYSFKVSEYLFVEEGQ
jgi:hypothetical protein